jgi:hypothetical protein
VPVAASENRRVEAPSSEVAKHDRAKQEKRTRNAIYAVKYKQRRCKDCGHRSSRSGKCRTCGGQMK